MKKEAETGAVTMVHCPKCSNRRLFDLQGTASGVVRIKCPLCRQEVEILLENCGKKRQERLTAYYHKQKIT